MEPEREITEVWQDNTIICHPKCRGFGDQTPTFTIQLLVVSSQLSAF